MTGWKKHSTVLQDGDPGMPKRLTQESGQTVSSAVPSTNMPHRLDTPGFPLRWHSNFSSSFRAEDGKKLTRPTAGHNVSTYRTRAATKAHFRFGY